MIAKLFHFFALADLALYSSSLYQNNVFTRRLLDHCHIDVIQLCFHVCILLYSSPFSAAP